MDPYPASLKVTKHPGTPLPVARSCRPPIFVALAAPALADETEVVDMPLIDNPRSVDQIQNFGIVTLQSDQDVRPPRVSLELFVAQQARRQTSMSELG